MITVDASDLKKEVNALAEFLQSKLQASVVRKGKMLVIEDSKNPTRTRDVKMYLKHFLHHRGFEDYRVTVDRSFVRVVKVKTHKRSKAPRKEGTVPHPADTMPWYYPWKT